MGLAGVVLDIAAVLVMEVRSGLRGVRRVVLLLSVCLLSVLNACMLLW